MYARPSKTRLSTFQHALPRAHCRWGLGRSRRIQSNWRSPAVGFFCCSLRFGPFSCELNALKGVHHASERTQSCNSRKGRVFCAWSSSGRIVADPETDSCLFCCNERFSWADSSKGVVSVALPLLLCLVRRGTRAIFWAAIDKILVTCGDDTSYLS